MIMGKKGVLKDYLEYIFILLFGIVILVLFYIFIIRGIGGFA